VSSPPKKEAKQQAQRAHAHQAIKARTNQGTQRASSNQANKK
jgi:hypothetical protein